MAAVYHHYQKGEIRELLLGRRVVSVEIFKPVRYLARGDGRWADRVEGRLLLDDGNQIFVVPNQGGCSCSSGDYDLTSLERVDNVITRVDVEDAPGDEWGEHNGTYHIFVLAGHEQINLLSVTGSDGNGYYGTGYELIAIAADESYRLREEEY